MFSVESGPSKTEMPSHSGCCCPVKGSEVTKSLVDLGGTSYAFHVRQKTIRSWRSACVKVLLLKQTRGNTAE